MICKHCGTEMKDDAKFCLGCGAPAEAPFTYYAPPVPNVVVQNNHQDDGFLPEKYRPLGAWTYFGLQILFAIPVVGFIFLIIFSCNGSNINRRNFARSYWCGLVIFGVIALVTLLIIVLLGGLSALAQ